MCFALHPSNLLTNCQIYDGGACTQTDTQLGKSMRKERAKQGRNGQADLLALDEEIDGIVLRYYTLEHL